MRSTSQPEHSERFQKSEISGIACAERRENTSNSLLSQPAVATNQLSSPCHRFLFSLSVFEPSGLSLACSVYSSPEPARPINPPDAICVLQACIRPPSRYRSLSLQAAGSIKGCCIQEKRAGETGSLDRAICVFILHKKSCGFPNSQAKCDK